MATPSPRRGLLPLLLLASLLAVPLPASGSDTGAAPVIKVSGAEACEPVIVDRAPLETRSHQAITIVGDEGPSGFIVGHDPFTGDPVYREGAGVTDGTGTAEDPYIIEGWLIEQATSGITLRSTDAHAIIRGNRLAHHASSAIVLEEADNVTVTGNVLETNVGAGVNVIGPATGISIIGNAMVNTLDGVRVTEAPGVRVAANAIRDSRGLGAWIRASPGALVEGNVVEGAAEDGIHAAGSPGSTVACNRLSGGQAFAVYVADGSSGSHVQRNFAEGHPNGLALSASHNASLIDNQVRGLGPGSTTMNLLVYESHDAVVSGNSASANEFGLLLRRGHRNVVTGNLLEAHDWAIFCTGNAAGSTPDSPTGADRNVLERNRFNDHQRSLVLRECTNTTVARNEMTGHVYDAIEDFEGRDNRYVANRIDGTPDAGIFLWREGGHLVQGNEITGARYGIQVYDAGEVQVETNRVHNASIGAVIDRAPSTRVTGNTLTDDAWGMYLRASPGTLVDHNRVTRNDVGIVIASEAAATRITANDVLGHTEHGLANLDDPPVDATGNWWGCSEGPGSEGCDSVHGNATFDPWRASPVPGLNTAPAIDPIDDRTVVEGQMITFTVTVQDPDLDPITLSAEGLPSGATFDPATGAFEWTPGPQHRGDHVVVFTASDGDLVASAAVTLTVVQQERPCADGSAPPCAR